MINASEQIGTSDVLFITLDTLRFDVAARALRDNRTPNLARVLPGGSWEPRHSPASFTYAAHQAFFAGFLPTPTDSTPQPRMFAAAFPGSETVSRQTAVFDAPDIVTGLASRGYHTACIGGVGFFNKRSPLGGVLPALFEESHWDESFGVSSSSSTEHQVDLALRILDECTTRLFLFLNVSALHQPNCIFAEGQTQDSPDTQLAALAYCDSHLGRLFDACARRAQTLCIICADHGTAYGEDGYIGHRIGHPVVWEVPYAEFILGHKP